MEKKIFVCRLKDDGYEFVLALDEKEALRISRGIKILGTHSVANWSAKEPKYQKYYKKYYGKKEK